MSEKFSIASRSIFANDPKEKQLLAELEHKTHQVNLEKPFWLNGMSSNALHAPFADDYRPSDTVFFLVDDDWNEKELVNLKHETGVDFLLGLQTTDKGIDEFDVVDGIIICKSGEVQRVMRVFDAAILCTGSNGSCHFEMKTIYCSRKSAHFIQASATGTVTSESDRIQKAINHIISQIPKGISIKSIIFSFERSGSFSLEEFEIAWESIVNNVVADDLYIYFADKYVIDKSECSWVGAIYVVD